MQPDLFSAGAAPHANHAAGDVSGTSHWNTTNLQGDELAVRKAKAQVQEAAVLALFRAHGQLGPWQVWELLDRQWPITSIRRAITNLTSNELLVKLPEFREGPEGAREHLWRLAA